MFLLIIEWHFRLKDKGALGNCLHLLIDIMQDLSITLIQSALHWQSTEANLAMFEEKIWQIKESTDIIVLPEMFNTGFTMAARENAEHSNGRTFQWMKQMAAQTGAVIIGSFIVNDRNSFFNRLFWVEPDAKFAFYDKRHLFRMANEHHYFEAGKSKIIPVWKGWRIFPLVCYDLRFPVWSRNFLKDGIPNYDLLIYIANWPQSRISAWNTLLKARAIENISYVVGVNRVGKDGNGILYNGCSAVIEPKGMPIWQQEAIEAIKTVKLEAEPLAAFRQKFPALVDADHFQTL